MPAATAAVARGLEPCRAARPPAGRSVGRVVVGGRAAPERGDRRAEVRLRRVAEGDDERMPVERRVHDGALYPDPPPVDQADLAQAGLGRGPDVLRDDGTDVARREGVEVELRLDRYRVRRVMIVHASPLPGS